MVSRWAEAADDVPYIKSIFIKLEADNRTRAVIVGRRLNLVLADQADGSAGFGSVHRFRYKQTQPEGPVVVELAARLQDPAGEVRNPLPRQQSVC